MLDNQKSIFKKFFNSATKSESDRAELRPGSNAADSTVVPASFNPPKFSFNKPLSMQRKSDAVKIPEMATEAAKVEEVGASEDNVGVMTNLDKDESSSNANPTHFLNQVVKMKFELRRQLHSFSYDLQGVSSRLIQTQNSLDLALLAMDEKIAEARGFNLDILLI